MTDTPIKPIPFRGELPNINSHDVYGHEAWLCERIYHFDSPDGWIEVHAQGDTQSEAIANWNAMVMPEVRELEWAKVGDNQFASTGVLFCRVWLESNPFDEVESWIARTPYAKDEVFGSSENAMKHCHTRVSEIVLSYLKGFEAEVGE